MHVYKQVLSLVGNADFHVVFLKLGVLHRQLFLVDDSHANLEVNLINLNF